MNKIKLAAVALLAAGAGSVFAQDAPVATEKPTIVSSYISDPANPSLTLTKGKGLPVVFEVTDENDKQTKSTITITKTFSDKKTTGLNVKMSAIEVLGKDLLLYSYTPGGEIKSYTAIYTWQRFDVNAGSFVDYSRNPSGTYSEKNVIDGKYRLMVSYEFGYSKSTGFAPGKCSDMDLLPKVDSVLVNGTSYAIVADSTNYKDKSDKDGVDYCRSVSRYVHAVSKTIEVGKAYKVSPKKACSKWAKKADGSYAKNEDGKLYLEDASCNVVYRGPDSAYVGDVVKYTLVNKASDWSFPIQYYPGINTSGVSVAAYDGNDKKGTQYPRFDFIDQDSISFSYEKKYAGNDSIVIKATTGYDKVTYKVSDGKGAVSGKEIIAGGSANVLVFKAVPNDGYAVSEIKAQYDDAAGETQTLNLSDACKALVQDKESTDKYSYQGQYGLKDVKYGDNLYACKFDAANGKPLQSDVKVFVKFAQSEDAYTVTLKKNEHATYSFVIGNYEHSSSKTEDVEVFSDIAGKTITIKVKPDEGYGLEGHTDDVYLSSKSGPVEGVFDKVEDGYWYYKIVVPAADKVTEKAVRIEVNPKPIHKVTLKTEGVAKAPIELTIISRDASEGQMVLGTCLFLSEVDGVGQPIEEEVTSCEILEGSYVYVNYDQYDGHPATLTGTASDLGPITFKESSGTYFTMPKANVVLNLKYTATNYTISKYMDTDAISFYSDMKGTKIEDFIVHELDTVYVKADDDSKMIYRAYVANGNTLDYVSEGWWRLVVPAKSVRIYTTYLDKHSVKVVTEGGPDVEYYSWIDRYGTNDVVDTIFVANEEISIGAIAPNGYSLDSVYADIAEEGKMVKVEMDDGQVLPDRDVNLKFFISPETYNITTNIKLIDGAKKGVVTAPSTAKTDEDVSVSIEPLANYDVDFVNVFYRVQSGSDFVKGEDGSFTNVIIYDTLSIDATKKVESGSYVYTFTMRAHDTYVDVAFKKIESSSSAKSSSSSAKATSSSSKKVSSSSAKATSSSSQKTSSSSAKATSSSSKKVSSSSAKASSSSSKKRSSSSSAKKDAIVATAKVPMFSVAVMGRNVQIAGASVGAKVAVFDMQGGLISAGRVDAANFNVAMPRSGSYMVRVGSQTQRVNVK